jgi:soluble cytochrome b562
LTRANEDLKDGRERLRLQNESLNNVVARKERLLQEMLERARKAEDENKELRAQIKADSAQQKKTLKEMQTALTESTALSEKSQREYITLKDAVKGLQDGWQADVDSLRSQLKDREESWKKEVCYHLLMVCSC